MIPIGNEPDWQRRTITLYYSDRENSISNYMGALWFAPDNVIGNLSVQPIRYIRNIQVYSVFTSPSEFQKYHPLPCAKRLSNRPNTTEYWERYGSLVVSARLVPHERITDASPPAMPWDKPFIADREEFWKSLPANSVIAEIGVDEAGTAKDIILPVAKPKKLYLVDPWDLIAEEDRIWINAKENRENVQQHFSKNPNVEVVHNFSKEAASQFEDEYFDVVFSDWALTYSDTKLDIFHWLNKVKRGGYLCGDLFCLEDHHWGGSFSAIMEFLAKYVIQDKAIIERQDDARNSLVSNLFHKYSNSKAIWDLEFYIREQPFGDLLIRYNSESYTLNGFATRREKNEDIIQLKPDLRTLMGLNRCPYFKYYPSSRVRAGTWRIEIGDWIDDLDLDEFEEWATGKSDESWIPVDFKP
tara:strand:- start:49 stop:1287 length:1239 start_codon:yes stop_codon:yes gene_type:complete